MFDDGEDDDLLLKYTIDPKQATKIVVERAMASLVSSYSFNIFLRFWNVFFKMSSEDMFFVSESGNFFEKKKFRIFEKKIFSKILPNKKKILSKNIQSAVIV